MSSGLRYIAAIERPSTIATIASEHPEHPAAKGRPGRVQIVVIDGPDMGSAVTLGASPVVIGCDPSCDLVLRDPRVSRRHLEVQVAALGRFLLVDLGSKNGTLFQGVTIERASVEAGATLRLGMTYLRIQPAPCGLALAPSERRRLGDLVGESLAMRELFAVLERAAESDVTVLLEGETGTGKELSARAIHDHGRHRDGPFVALDCGALPEGLVESELFGHVRGAFTGAMAARKGAFVRASGGTLFLDELDSLPLNLQPRLLRALESARVRPVGGDAEVEIDVRVIAASQADLSLAVARGEFRPDLYYRLSVLKIVLPPLRERREDLVLTTQHLLAKRGFSASDSGPAASVKGPNLERLIAYDWPGNVRQLRNVLDRALALSPGADSFSGLRILLPGDQIESGGEPFSVRHDLPFARAKKLVIDTFEARYLSQLFLAAEGNISAAARKAGIDRKHLRTLLRKHGILPADP
ncbi:MAG TPA: FHA domain-containing protein [Nannocystis exedens]|nr:FHA domain-containing protein [Nannocystis exedens]